MDHKDGGYYYDLNDRCPQGAFRYSDLDPTTPSTRLIRLLRAERLSTGFLEGQRRVPTNQVRNGRNIHSSNRKAYDAVSYSWETNEMNRVIELSGKALKVSSVVESILLRLRREKEDRLLWIDQICINQNDQDEKASQVERMKDIFGGGRTVIASLGLHITITSEPMDSRKGVFTRDLRTEHESLSLDTISKQKAMLSNIDLALSRNSKTRTRSLVDKISNEQAMKTMRDFRSRFWLSDYEEKTIADFLDSPWFSRVWVVQEVAVARKLVVICGDEEVDGRRFKKLCSGISSNARNAKLKSKLAELRPLLRYICREDSDGQGKPELLDLLQKFRPWKASVPHDKVFALLGLSKEGADAPLLRPDYKVSVEVVFRRVVQHMIERYKSLAVLTYAMQSETRTQTQSQSLQQVASTTIQSWWS